jgi:hypothetical protein
LTKHGTFIGDDSIAHKTRLELCHGIDGALSHR